MEEKKSHTKNERSLPDHEEQELWFSALVADDSCAYNVDKAFDRFVSRTQQKRRTVFNIPKIVYGAAAVILLLIASTISYWWGERQLQNQFADILVEAPLGAKTKLILPDSTLVWLNAGSKIVYSQGFGVKDRHLRLNGEAYFEVTRTGKMFEVHCKGMDVQVLGTSFNIMAYRDEPAIQTTLVNGRVQVNSDRETGGSIVMEPGYQVQLDTLTGKMEMYEVNVANFVGWKEKLFVFDDENMETMMRKLARWYDVDIVIESPKLRKSVFYGVIRKYENISKILDMLKKTQNIDYVIENKRIVIKEAR